MSYVRALTICLLLVCFVSAAGCHCFDLLGFDPNSLVNQRVKAIMSTMHKQNVNPGV